MGSSWRTAHLGDVASFANGLNFSREQEGSGLPVLKVKDFARGHFFSDVGLDHVDPVQVRLGGGHLLEEGDIVLVRSNGNPDLVARAAMFVGAARPVSYSGFCIRARVDVTKADPRFVLYMLRSPAARRWLISRGSGTAIQNVSQDSLGKLPFPLPALPEQRAIASILGALDDRIELNRRMSRTLDVMMQAIFKSWFVDFEGADAVDQTTRLPVGWTSRRVGDVLRIAGGTTPSTKRADYWEFGTSAFCTPRDMSRIGVPVLLDTERYVTDRGLVKTGSGLLPSGTVLMSSRAPIGYVALASLPVAVNQGIIAMVCDEIVSNYYALCWTRHNLPVIISQANGSTFLEISKGTFKDIEMLVPSRARLASFDSVAAALFNRMVLAERNARSARNVRDALLPGLLSGSFQVR